MRFKITAISVLSEFRIEGRTAPVLVSVISAFRRMPRNSHKVGDKRWKPTWYMLATLHFDRIPSRYPVGNRLLDFFALVLVPEFRIGVGDSE